MSFVSAIGLNESGIYRIRFEGSDNLYIGSAKSFRKRWNCHIRTLRNGTHHNAPLQYAYAKYGEHLIRYEVVELCRLDELVCREQYFIDVLDPAYNICRTAHSTLGCKRTEAEKEHLRRLRLGTKLSDETRRAISAANLGRKRSDQARANLARARTGTTLSIEIRQKISRSHIGKSAGERNPMYGRSGADSPAWGRKWTAEAREHLSAVQRGHLNHMYGVRGGDHPTAKPVLCIELGERFPSLQDAVIWLKSRGLKKAGAGSISSVCSGRQKSAYGFTWREAA